ncbi:MAG TPA: isoprenyl transferase [Pirellula sp.]|nr:isoprenyl transferase [Pirellula sp.]
MSLFRGKPKTEPGIESENVEKFQMPKHVAVIMDGNGRWAQARGLPRIEGHRKGANTVRRISEVCRELGVSYLTLYCFSNENWKRPKEELSFLMSLLKTYLIQERPTLIQNDIRLTIIGRREGIPDEVQTEMDRSVELSRNGKSLTLCLAINYGSRQEIVDAVRGIVSKVQNGVLDPAAIDESMIASHLYTAGMPDPDLLIRTSGEMRISNYLLWQISYSELWITDKPWPEFDKQDMVQAIADYNKRDRRFGGLGEVRNR